MTADSTPDLIAVPSSTPTPIQKIEGSATDVLQHARALEYQKANRCHNCSSRPFQDDILVTNNASHFTNISD